MIETPPMVPLGLTHEVARGVYVMPDQRVEFVPNAGIVVGTRATLVIDTAMGPRNGERILGEARRLGEDRKLLLTTTHFHPEHAFGAQSFAEATYICNTSQTTEMAAKGPEYIEMFSGFGPGLAELLSDVHLVTPDISFDGPSATLDLGGVTVQLITIGPAHTRGDMVVFLPESGVLFAGDLVEDRFLPIFPDPDANGLQWLSALDRLEALRPKIVVGGHGDVGDTGLIANLRDYLIAVRDGVDSLRSENVPLEEIEQRLEPELAARQAGWDNQMWIKSAIDSFHAARTG
jgi:glyoxylase-like metal-dependent hydrolase (beta-lactamase superfamily II)